MSRDFRDLFAAFNAAGVKYLVVGAHAYSYYAKPRFTKDLDVWVEPVPENAVKVVAALNHFGAPKTHFSVEDFSRPGGTLQIGVAPVRIDVLTDIAALNFKEAWRNRVEDAFLDQPIHIIALSDLLKNKRAVGRPHDRLDVRNLEALLKTKKPRK